MDDTKNILTLEIVREWQNSGSLEGLETYTAIEDAAAEALSMVVGDIDLDGLTALSDTQALALSKSKGSLYLRAITSVSDFAAEAFFRHEGELFLDNLTSLSHVGLAKKLTYRGYHDTLNLPNLDTLPEAVAEVLSKTGLELILDGLKSLTHLGLAKKLAAQNGDKNSLELTSLSAADAAELYKHEGHLDFPKLKILSEAAAKGVAKHKGKLFLDYLESLSGPVAQALSTHQGGISFDGITSLSDEAAIGLSNLKGRLDLSSLTYLSDVAAEALSRHQGTLNLGHLKSLSDTAAAALSKHKGPLCLPLSSISLSEAAARSLFMYTGGVPANLKTPLLVQDVKSFPFTVEEQVDLANKLITALCANDFIWKAEGIGFPDEQIEAPRDSSTFHLAYEVMGTAEGEDDICAMEESIQALKGKFAEVILESGRRFCAEVTAIEIFNHAGFVDDPDFNAHAGFFLDVRLRKSVTTGKTGGL